MSDEPFFICMLISKERLSAIPRLGRLGWLGMLFG